MGTRIDFQAPSVAQDFWRTPTTAGALPDGVNDVTENIARTGNTGIGSFLAAPVAKLDVAVVGRSGVDGRVAGVTPFYATGNIPFVGNGATSPPATPVGGNEFRHSNQTQGIGIAYDGIYATGDTANQNFSLMQRGAGQYFIYHQTLLSSNNWWNWVGPSIANANEGWQQRWFAAGVQEFGMIQRRSALALPGGGTGANEWFFQKRTSAGTFRNSLSLRNSLCLANASRIEVGDNEVVDDKLVLFGVDSNVFFGFGIKSSTLAAFVSSNAGHFRYYQGACPGTQVFGVSGLAVVTVDPGGTNTGVNGVGTLRFGGEAATQWIGSKKTVGGNQDGLDFGTANAVRVSIRNNGLVNLSAASRPVFANDGAAGVGGLVAGDIYRDALGLLHVKL